MVGTIIGPQYRHVLVICGIHLDELHSHLEGFRLGTARERSSQTKYDLVYSVAD